MNNDIPLVIRKKTINNYFFLDTGKFKSNQDMKRKILENISVCQMQANILFFQQKRRIKMNGKLLYKKEIG